MATFTEPKAGASGLYCVDWAFNFVHWLAWREWLAIEFEKTFFPQRMTTMFAWPPTTGEGALMVAQMIGEIRSNLVHEKGSHTGSLKAVPDAVPPWREWPAVLKRDVAECEIARRADWGTFFQQASIYPISPRLGARWDRPASCVAVKVPDLRSRPKFIPRYNPGADTVDERATSDAPLSDAVRASKIAKALRSNVNADA